MYESILCKGTVVRILHTEWIRTKGGQAMRVLEDLRIIQELGHTPLLACRKESWLYKEAKNRGFEVHAVAFGHLANPKAYFAMFGLIRREKIDIVHTHSSKDSYPATYAAKMLGKKVVRSRHIELTKKPGHLFHLADAIVTTGQKVREQLIEAGIDENKIVSIPTCPDPARFSPDPGRREKIRKEYGIAENDIVIGSMAGSGIRKRGRALVEMMTNIRQNDPKAELLLAGDARGDAGQKMERLIQEKNLQDCVKFVGYVEPEIFLDAVDIYACPSSQEGLPQALMQAMMMGKACISTDVGSIADLDVEQNIFLIEKNDLAAFAQTLNRLVNDRRLREELGAKNRRIALECFSYERMKTKTAALYESLTADRRGRA